MRVGQAVKHWEHGRGVIVAISDSNDPANPSAKVRLNRDGETFWAPVSELMNAEGSVGEQRQSRLGRRNPSGRRIRVAPGERDALIDNIREVLSEHLDDSDGGDILECASDVADSILSAGFHR